MSFIKAAGLLSAFAGLTLPLVASAGIRTSNLQVSVTIVNDCSIATDSGDGRAAVTLACTPGTPYVVVLQHSSDEKPGSAPALYRVLHEVQARGGAAFGRVGDGSAQMIRINPGAVRVAGDCVVATIWY